MTQERINVLEKLFKNFNDQLNYLNNEGISIEQKFNIVKETSQPLLEHLLNCIKELKEVSDFQNKIIETIGNLADRVGDVVENQKLLSQKIGN